MPLIVWQRVLQNLLVVGVLAWVFFLIYSQMDKEQVKQTINAIKGMFNKGGKSGSK